MISTPSIHPTDDTIAAISSAVGRGARALVRRPAAFLMDEPLGALDATFRETMRAEIKRLHIAQNATTVYVTHDQIEAMAMGIPVVSTPVGAEGLRVRALDGHEHVDRRSVLPSPLRHRLHHVGARPQRRHRALDGRAHLLPRLGELHLHHRVALHERLHDGRDPHEVTDIQPLSFITPGEGQVVRPRQVAV